MNLTGSSLSVPQLITYDYPCPGLPYELGVLVAVRMR